MTSVCICGKTSCDIIKIQRVELKNAPLNRCSTLWHKTTLPVHFSCHFNQVCSKVEFTCSPCRLVLLSDLWLGSSDYSACQSQSFRPLSLKKLHFQCSSTCCAPHPVFTETDTHLQSNPWVMTVELQDLKWGCRFKKKQIVFFSPAVISKGNPTSPAAFMTPQRALQNMSVSLG